MVVILGNVISDGMNIRTNKLKHNLWCCFELFSILQKIFKAQGRWKIKVGRCLTKLLFCLVLLALIFIFHMWPCDLEKEKREPATFDFNFERTNTMRALRHDWKQVQTQQKITFMKFAITTIHENMLFCFCSTFKFQRENEDKLDGVLEKLCYVLPWCSSMGPLGEVRGWSPPVPRYLTRFNKGRKFSSFMAWISYKLKHFLFDFDQPLASPTSMTTPTSTTGWSPPRDLTHYNKGRQFFP